MTPDLHSSFDALVAAYFEGIDAGANLDPKEFIAAHPEYRTRFLDFLRHELTIAERFEPSSAPRLSGSLRTPPLSAMPAKVGEYRIERLLGRGGMGTVFQARRPTDDAPVALKLLHAQNDLAPASRQRFKREVCAIETLQHDHIVPLYSTGEDLGQSFLTMKLIDGVTLADVREASEADEQRPQQDAPTALGTALPAALGTALPDAFGTDRQLSETPLSQRSATECFARACGNQNYFRGLAGLLANAADALEAAHQQHIVHRDVKPSNLLLDADGKLWLTDFGLASLGVDQTALTGTGELLGTPAYMSPEQAVGSHSGTDCRTDIYSLGATLYELATLRRPFTGGRYEILVKVIAGNLVRPSHHRPEIPQGLEAIILKAMAQEPSERYQTAARFAADLRRFAAGASVVAKLPGRLDKAARWVARHPRQSGGVLTAAIAIVAVVMSLQYLSGERLEDLNAQLGRNVETLADANSRLQRTNTALDHSRARLQHHLYVADMAAAFQAYAKRDTDAAQQLLQRHLPGEGEVDRRRFAWWLLHQLTRSPQALNLVGHRGAAREVRYVPSRGEIVSSGDDGTVRRWDALSDEPLGIHQLTGGLDALAVSADGRLFVTGHNLHRDINPVTVRDLESGEVQHQLTGHHRSVEAAAFSPDGRWIATADRYEDVILHSTDGRFVGRVTTDSRNETIAFTADSQSLAAIEQRRVAGKRSTSLRLWSVPGLERQQKIDVPFSPSCLAISRDGDWLLAAGRDEFALVHLKSGATLSHLNGIRGKIRSATFSDPADQIAIGCDNGLVYLWSLAGLEPSQLDTAALPSPEVIATGTQMVTSVDFMEHESLLTADEGGSVQLWDISELRQRTTEISGGVTAWAAAAQNPSQLFLRTSADQIERLDWETRRLHPFLAIDADADGELAVSPNGRWLAAAAPGELVLAAIPSGKIIRRIPTSAPEQAIDDLLFFPNGEQVLVLLDSHFRIYDASTDSWSQQVELSEDGAEELLLSPDEATLLVTTGGAWLFFDAATREPLDKRLPGFGGFTGAAAFSTTGRWLAGGHEDGTVILIDTEQAQGVHTEPIALRGHRESVYACQFIDDDETLVTISSDGMMRFWDVATGRELGVLTIGESDLSFLAYDPASEQLLTAGPRGPTRIWSIDPRGRERP